MNKPWQHCVWIAIGLLLIQGGMPPAALSDSAKARRKEWAQPIQLEGVPNLHKVSDDLYRSAQPTATGMQNLKRMGIRTVVCLRANHSDQEILAETGLSYEAIPMNTWDIEAKDAAKFLRIVTDPKRRPVLVHCQHGADRTGTMCATYRIAVQGWSKEAAIDEMVHGNFGFHGVWRNLIHWVEKLDVPQIRREAGISQTVSREVPNEEPAGAVRAGK